MHDIHVLIVDDDDDFRNMIADSVEQYFPIQQAASGREALAYIAEQPCEIALLDVQMPGMNGYELCETILATHPDTRIIFVSGDDTLQARMTAYDAGADDFIAKPFRVAELILKLRRMKEVIQNAKELQDSIQQATEVAMQAMSSTGEMGCVLEFTRNLSQSHNVDHLLKSLITTASSGFGLKVSAQIRLDDQQKTLDSMGRANPLEAEMLRSLSQDSNRIYSMGKRLIINYPRITLQVKDMPLDDPDKCGRLRDHIALLVDASEQRLDGIVMDQKLRRQQQLMQSSMLETRQTITDLDLIYRQQASENMAVFDQIRSEMEQAMVYLGLTESQERTVMKIIDAGAAHAGALYDQGLALDDKFAGILSSLSDAAGQEVSAPEAAQETDSDAGSIILF